MPSVDDWYAEGDLLRLQSALGGNETQTAPFRWRSISIAMTDANTTLSAAQYACPDITLTGTLTANRNLILPLLAGAWYNIFNNTAGGFSLVCEGASGSSVTIANGKSALIRSDGTNYKRISADVTP